MTVSCFCANAKSVVQFNALAWGNINFIFDYKWRAKVLRVPVKVRS